MTISLGGVELLVGPPAIPTFQVAPPSASGGVLVPVPGVQGPPGASGNTFVHVQSTPAATWTITHNLGTKPAVVLELASDPDALVFTDLTYPDLNTVVVEWPTAESGKAYL